MPPSPPKTVMENIRGPTWILYLRAREGAPPRARDAASSGGGASDAQAPQFLIPVSKKIITHFQN